MIMKFFFIPDLFKAKRSKGKYYTPNYVISVVYPPLARYASIWPECAKKVFAKMGRRSGFKSEMMPIFNAIHRAVKSHDQYKPLSKRKGHEVMRIASILETPPPGTPEKPWKEAVVKLWGKDTWTTRHEYEEKLSGLMAHAFNFGKKHSIK